MQKLLIQQEIAWKVEEPIKNVNYSFAIFQVVLSGSFSKPFQIPLIVTI